ncbi:sodium-dependent proline transporter-like [Amphibalanus amphitrite]|uniref:sodium-dependent proline transporter-like n=1 Tax=Amphibalanus amphitrite TaxID=1232801 RepID=UPI001C90C8B3|nr:sodium-dependent proline transporter-like [Amphibalanus amphitrite]
MAVDSPSSEHPTRGTEQEMPREKWRTQCDFILCSIGKTVGLGNIWRFPFMSLRYGGITFLSAYLILLVVVGVPLYVLEIVLGQYSSAGPRSVFSRMAPVSSGIGTAMLLVLAFTVFTYNLPVAWIIFFTAASFNRSPPWGECGHEYNSPRCVSLASNVSIVHDVEEVNISIGSSSQQKRYLLEEASSNDSDIASAEEELHLTQWRNVSSSAEFFFCNVLGLCDQSSQSLGVLRWDIVLCMLAAWLLVAACIFRGITSVGMILHFTVIFPYVVLVILLFPAVLYDGAMKGIQFYGTFNVSLLWSSSLWSDAASQIFFSLGISHGDVISLASFNRFRNNCMRDAILLAVVDTVTSILAVLVVFAMLGVTANQLGQEINSTHKLGLGLAFVTYPEALLHTPYPSVISVLFFVMLITMGLDSQFTMVEMLSVAVVDEWPRLRPQRHWISMGVCAAFFAANLCMCLDGGVRVFVLFDHFAFSFSQFAVALLEILAVGWAFGAERVLDLMSSEMKIPMSQWVKLYWRLAWRFAAPVVLVAVLGSTVAFHGRVSFTAGDTRLVFQPWEDGIGLVLMLAPAVLVVLTALWVMGKQWRRGGTLKEVLHPTADWGPAQVERHAGTFEGGSGVANGNQFGNLRNIYLARLGHTVPLAAISRRTGLASRFGPVQFNAPNVPVRHLGDSLCMTDLGNVRYASRSPDELCVDRSTRSTDARLENGVDSTNGRDHVIFSARGDAITETSHVDHRSSERSRSDCPLAGVDNLGFERQ